jgi:hypothetical protein
VSPAVLGRTLLWLLCAIGVAVVAVGALVFGVYGLARGLGSISEENLRGFEILLPFYFRLVCFRGIVPCLAIAIPAFALLARAFPDVETGRARRLAALAASAALAYALVGPLLLMAEFEGAVKLAPRGIGDHLGTAVGIIGGTVLCAWLPRWLVGPLRAPLSASSREP